MKAGAKRPHAGRTAKVRGGQRLRLASGCRDGADFGRCKLAGPGESKEQGVSGDSVRSP